MALASYPSSPRRVLMLLGRVSACLWLVGHPEPPPSLAAFRHRRSPVTGAAQTLALNLLVPSTHARTWEQCLRQFIRGTTTCRFGRTCVPCGPRDLSGRLSSKHAAVCLGSINYPRVRGLSSGGSRAARTGVPVRFITISFTLLFFSYSVARSPSAPFTPGRISFTKQQEIR